MRRPSRCRPWRAVVRPSEPHPLTLALAARASKNDCQVNSDHAEAIGGVRVAQRERQGFPRLGDGLPTPSSLRCPPRRSPRAANALVGEMALAAIRGPGEHLWCRPFAGLPEKSVAVGALPAASVQVSSSRGLQGIAFRERDAAPAPPSRMTWTEWNGLFNSARSVPHGIQALRGCGPLEDPPKGPSTSGLIRSASSILARPRPRDLLIVGACAGMWRYFTTIGKRRL